MPHNISTNIHDQRSQDKWEFDHTRWMSDPQTIREFAHMKGKVMAELERLALSSLVEPPPQNYDAIRTRLVKLGGQLKLINEMLPDDYA